MKFTRISILAILLILAISVTDGTTVEPSIAHSVFLPRQFDPYCDTYVETVTRMSVDELMRMPQLSDMEFVDQLARGVDSVLVSTNRANPNSLFDPNIDDQLEYQANIETEWLNLMSDGPACINYVGSVMTVASKKDFPLVVNATFNLIMYPQSFHATLVQVSNDMYRALFTAHTSMEKIQLNMRQIPMQIKTALKLITQASVPMVKAMLPRTLSNIGSYANDSATAARASLDRFEQLQKLLEQVVLASVLTNNINRNISASLESEAQKIKEEKEKMDASIAQLAAERADAAKRLEEARKSYHTAMLNVPGGEWDAAAWQVYAANRPAVLCHGWWFWRKCTSQREQQFTEFSNEAKAKAEEALKNLNKAKEDYDTLFKQEIGKQDDLTAAISNLASINFNEASINQTIKILLDAAGRIALVQTQWSSITRFFNKLAMQTEHTQKVIMQDFLGTIATFEAIDAPLDPIDKFFFVTLLVEAAKEIDRDSHLLFLMAKTYSDVSNEYMVDQIAGIAGLLSLQSDADRTAQLQAIESKTIATTIKVKNLGVERMRNYELVNINRQQQYMQFIEEGTAQEQLNILNGIGIGKRK